MKSLKTSPRRHPQEEASFVSRVMLWWIIPLLWKGWRRPLEQDDLHPVRDKDQSRKLTEHLEEKWEQEKDIAKRGINFYSKNLDISPIVPLTVNVTVGSRNHAQ